MCDKNYDKLISLYKDGRSLDYISKKIKLPKGDVESFFKNLKNKHRFKRAYTDDFKIIIAERDISDGASRRKIASELGISTNTVRRACEDFGQPFKEVVSKNDIYERIDGVFNKEECISCNSIKVNRVDDNTFYCKRCGSEHIINSDHALKIKWEYLS